MHTSYKNNLTPLSKSNIRTADRALKNAFAAVAAFGWRRKKLYQMCMERKRIWPIIM